MPVIEISTIVVDPSQRQREDLGDIEGLKRSLQDPPDGFGQLEPILLDKDHKLIAGFRRLTAMAMLGKTHIRVEYLGDIDEIRAQEIELEENIRRHQLSWQEESRAIEKIHLMKQKKDPNWSVEKTAEAVGVSRRKAYMSLELSQALDKDPEVGKADTQQGAMMRLSRNKQMKERKEAAAVRMMAQETGMVKKVRIDFHLGDALELLQKMPSESADMAVSNPPFGVNIEDLFIGDKTVYSDKPEDIVPLLYQVTREVFRVLKKDRWFVWFYPTSRLEEAKDMLKQAGFAFEAVPCVWIKTNKHLSSLGQPFQQFNKQYESFFWARKGAARFNKLREGNVFDFPTPGQSRIHPLQMPVALWKEILEIGSVGGETILEPFSGSGSCGVACLRTDRNYDGLELSSEYVERAKMWVNEVQTGEADETSANLAQDSAEGFAALKSMEA